MKNSAFFKPKISQFCGILITVSLLGSLLVFLAVPPLSIAANQLSDTSGTTVTRTLPVAVLPGQAFNVTITFTAPSDNFNAIGLSDFAPEGWDLKVNNTWNSPPSNTSNTTAKRVDYIWNGPFTGGTSFTATYQVTAPLNAANGTYLFTNSSPAPRLEYYVAGTGPFKENITGQNTVNIGAASPSTTLLTSSLNPSPYGQPVTFTAAVSAAAAGAGAPTGTVTFKDGDIVLGTDNLEVDGQAYLASSLSSGNHSLSAAYSGDANFAPSTSVVLIQTVTQPIAGGGGGGSPPPSISLAGFKTQSLPINSSGVLQSAVRLQTVDAKLTLDISLGTKMLNSSNNALGSLNVSPLTSPPAAPAGHAIVMAYSFSPDGAKFDPALTLTFAYDPAQLPPNITGNDLYIAFFDGQQWQKLETAVDLSARTVTARVTHFSHLALVAGPPPISNTATAIPSPVTVQPTTAPPSPVPLASPTLETTPPPATSLPAVVSSPAAPASAPVSVSPSVKSGGVNAGIIAGVIGVIVVLVIVAFILNKRRHK